MWSAPQTMLASVKSSLAETASGCVGPVWARISSVTLFALVLSLAVGVGEAPAAAPPQPIALTVRDRAAVAEIEAFLNGITTLQAEFVQLTASGSYARGNFYLKRPGRMRFEYDPPVPYLLVSDGRWFIYVDKQLEQVTYLPLSKTPADVLLREEFSFSDGLVITGIERRSNTIRLDLVDAEDPEIGRISMTFQQNPVTLRSWTILDAQGQRIQVTLMDPRYGLRLDNDLFRFVNTFDRKRPEK